MCVLFSCDLIEKKEDEAVVQDEAVVKDEAVVQDAAVIPNQDANN